MSFPPNLFLVGAQKAGTTYLATLLGQHPDICLADPKEPDYFTRNQEKGEDWYRDCFMQHELQFLLDASPSYSAAPLSSDPGSGRQNSSPMAGVPERISKLAPDARFIYLMRDPVKRTYSAYWHAVRAGDERRPFNEVIRTSDYILRMGCYHYQLSQYFQYFDSSRFLLLFFEDLIRQPEAIAARCFEWLGLTSFVDFQLSQGKNESYTWGPALGWLDQKTAALGGIKSIAGVAKRYLPHEMLYRMRGMLSRPIPPLGPEDEEWLARYFAEPNAILESELRLDLPDWTKPSLGNRG